MPKPKVVTNPKPIAIPSSPARRALSVEEEATNWVNDKGLIYADEGIKRVFRAATKGGFFSVCTKGNVPGAIDRLDFVSFAQALMVTIHYMIQQRRPMLYAVYETRDSLIGANGYKDKESGKFVSQFDATADLFDYFYDMWCEDRGFKTRPMTPYIDKLRTPRRRRVIRERLPIKIKRERL